jgi:predicted anti-sigma-YlaC factor YlaD
MKKSCEQIRDLLVDYADGRLSETESFKVKEHLTKCEPCRRMLNALQKSLELAEVIWDDALEQTKDIRVSIPPKARKIHWLRYAAVAAGILIVITTSIVWRSLVRPAKEEISFEDIERRITESASAARLLAAAELLARYSDNEAIVKEQYRYIVDMYPQTSEAEKARLKIQ